MTTTPTTKLLPARLPWCLRHNGPQTHRCFKPGTIGARDHGGPCPIIDVTVTPADVLHTPEAVDAITGELRDELASRGFTRTHVGDTGEWWDLEDGATGALRARAILEDGGEVRVHRFSGSPSVLLEWTAETTYAPGEVLGAIITAAVAP